MKRTDPELQALRTAWAEAWGKKPHNHISRKMLKESLAYKWRQGGFTYTEQQRLDTLVADYKKNQHNKRFKIPPQLKPGTRLVRLYKGKQHQVIAGESGCFEYDGQTWKSLSAIANHITGSRWNGNIFFGLRG